MDGEATERPLADLISELWRAAVFGPRAAPVRETPVHASGRPTGPLTRQERAPVPEPPKS